MGQTGEWVPGDAPLDEGYWEALLRDGENGYAAPPADQSDSWGWGAESNQDNPGTPGASAAAAAVPVVDQWQHAREAMEQGKVLQVQIVGHNRGGVLVGWNGLRGFVPASHLVNLSSFADEDQRYDELRGLVGSQLRVKVIELDPERERFVLSERASHLDEDQRQGVLSTLCPGDICRGNVTNLCSFGAFVDLGGLEGLVHVSELSWGRVDHPRDVLDAGQSVEVYVLNIDRKRGRVGLSIKRLQPDPWQAVEERYYVGQVIESVITHVVDFGAFARVEEGLEGLIHVSELAEGNFLHPRNVVSEGDTVTARILNIDSERRRMGLSLRQMEEPFAPSA
jgi:small subunit ribosomal protein S1